MAIGMRRPWVAVPRECSEPSSLRVDACVAVGAIADRGAAPQALAQNPPHQSWQTNGTVRAVVISHGVVYLGGQFTTMRPANAPLGSTRAVVRRNAAAINATTGGLLPWNPGVTGRVDALRVIGNRVYLGGLFTAVGGKARANVAAVGPDAGKPTAWHANTNGSVRAIEATPGGNVLLGGDFTRVAGTARTRLAEVTPASKVRPGHRGSDRSPALPVPHAATPRSSRSGCRPTARPSTSAGTSGWSTTCRATRPPSVPLANGSTTLAFNPEHL